MLSHLRKFWSEATASMGRHIFQQSRKPVHEIDSKRLSILSQTWDPINSLAYSPTNTGDKVSEKLLKLKPLAMHQCIRTKVRVYYKGSAWKRYNKHNIEKRLTTPGGLEMLWRKTLKGRLNLAAYERILPNTVNSKILPQHHFKYKAHPLTKRRLPKPGLF
ncbi:hypothetical protein PoB_003304900 [Plakobranchus ocellatus]|uniref:39S ribosomal protein L35, mitochondrial n=1 Tax=Plakobranchus ocellatus TaxID=259542 RepID=A0AAV4AFU4_9GAST|nr:hypothetical protein PoB_003304900 [Plakobranchus ocellatus]